MKTHVAQLSLEAFWSIQGTLNAKQAAVLHVIKVYGPISNYDIARHLDWEINCVTGRTYELRSKGLVEEAWKEVNPHTQKRGSAWRCV